MAEQQNPNSPGAQKPQSNNGSLLSFPTREMPHSILLVFKKYKYTTIEEGYSLLKTKRSGPSQRSGSAGVDLKDSVAIELPFPTQLTDNTSLRVGGFERDPVTESLAALGANALGNGNKTISEVLNDGAGFLKNLGVKAANLTNEAGNITVDGVMDGGMNVLKEIGDTNAGQLTRAAAYLLRSKLPGDIGKSIDLALGTTINPRETLAFEGVNLKTHSFSWELYPSNRQDSQQIRTIVNTVKRNSLPETADLGDPNSGFGVAKAFLNYPSTVDMYLLGVNTEHFVKFKTSMVSDVSVDYGGGGIVSILQGGVPAKVTLSMTFNEMQIHTSEEYPDGLIAEPPAQAEQNPQE